MILTITIYTVYKKYLTITIPSEALVDDLKSIIQDNIGVNQICIYLYYKGNFLCDGELISNYNITNGSMILQTERIIKN